MAMGTVTFRSDMISPAIEIEYGNKAQKWMMEKVSGEFPKEAYGIRNVLLDLNILRAYDDKRQLLIRNQDGVLLGNLWVGDSGFQEWTLSRDLSYDKLRYITTDGGDKPACTLRAGTYIYIYVNWETTEAEITDPPTKFPDPVVNNALQKYPTAGDVLRTTVAVSFDGVDISDPINRNLLSMSYTDNEEDEADDLQIKIHDKDKKWLGQWLNDTMIQASFGSKQGTKGLTISAGVKQYRDGKINSGNFGLFELDSIKVSGPPTNIIIKGTSLPFSGIRTEERNKCWEGYTLKGIGAEIARKGGLGFVYDCPSEPKYSRVEQAEQTDIAFLMQLCHDNGFSLKISGMKLVIFDQSRYENMSAACVVRWMDGTYIRYDLETQDGEKHYDEVTVVYYDVSGAVKYTASARTDDYDEKASEHTTCTVTTRKVHSASAAGELARQILRLHNKYERKVSITLIGNPILGAGMTMTLQGFGLWDDKYIIKTCKHEIGPNGYTTKVTLRSIPEGRVVTTKTEQGEKKAVVEYSHHVNYDGQYTGGTYGFTAPASSGGGGSSSGKGNTQKTPTIFEKAATVAAATVQSAFSALSNVASVMSAVSAASKPVSKGSTPKTP